MTKIFKHEISLIKIEKKNGKKSDVSPKQVALKKKKKKLTNQIINLLKINETHKRIKLFSSGAHRGNL